MRRRSFFGAGAVLGLTSLRAGLAGSYSCRVELVQTGLAGYPYFEADRVFDTLHEGMPLVLRREVSNPFDRNAVEILTEAGVKLGYVPRAWSPIVARNLDRGIPVKAEISRLDPNAESWDRIHVECFVELPLQP